MALLVSGQVGFFLNVKMERQPVNFIFKLKIYRISVQSRAKFRFLYLRTSGLNGSCLHMTAIGVN